MRSEVLGVDTLNYKNNYWDVYKNLDLLNAIKYDSDVGYGDIQRMLPLVILFLLH